VSAGGVVDFIASGFGGGWLIPLSDEAADACEIYFGEPATEQPAIGGTSGYIVEPQDLADTLAALRALRCEVAA
jgi:hypothetical protein